MPPIYDYRCPRCDWSGEIFAPVDTRDEMACPCCNRHLHRLISGRPFGKLAGQVLQGGGGDRFTADMLGVPLKELPRELKMDYTEGK
jgi:putative FmdB family regulatory protein